MNIIGFYKDWNLVERDEFYWVVDRPNKQILFKSEDEETATKMFVKTIIDLHINNEES